MAVKIFALTLANETRRLTDVYGDGTGVVDREHNVAYRTLQLRPDPANAGVIVLAGRNEVALAPLPAGYAAQVIADGAVAYWRLGETAGTTAVDVIGGANGTISGGVTLNQAGAVSDGDRAMLFNGTTGIVTIPAGAVSLGTNPVTLEAWMKTPLLQDFKYPIDFKRDGDTSAAGLGFMVTASGRVYFDISYGNGNGVQPGAVVPYADGQWHHVVGVILRGSPDTAILYFDGVQVVTAALTVSGVSFTPTTPSGIGAAAGLTNPFQGSLDEVAIYKTALTPAQIQAHYAAATPSYPSRVLRDGASAYWRLGEASGTVARDELGAANGTISGGVTLGQAGALSDGNTAMQFNGTTGLVSAPSSVLNCGPSTQSFTVEFWVKSAYPDTGVWHGLVRKGSFPFNNLQFGWEVQYLNPASLRFCRNPGTTTAPTALGGFPLAPNVWSHVTITYDASTGVATAYVNGVLASTRTWAGPDAGTYTDTYPVDIGKSSYGAAAGLIDEVAIYPVALTAQQVAAHYAARTARPGPGVAAPLTLGPFARSGPLRLSDLYASGTGRLLITGVPF